MQIVDFYNQINPIQKIIEFKYSFPNWGFMIWQSVYMSNESIRNVVLDKRLQMNRRINKNLRNG